MESISSNYIKVKCADCGADEPEDKVVMREASSEYLCSSCEEDRAAEEEEISREGAVEDEEE